MARRGDRLSDQRLAQQWEWAKNHTSYYGRPCHLAQIERVYQRARRGSKAIIVWPGGRRQDTWFWRWHAIPGYYVLLQGTTRYGPHNSDPQVFYVEVPERLAVLPPEAPYAWERHQHRLAKETERASRQAQPSTILRRIWPFRGRRS